MDLSKVLAELRLELQNLEAAIQSLERLQEDKPRRGRPPKSLAHLSKAADRDGEDVPSEET